MSAGIAFGASFLQYLLVFFVFIAVVAVAVIIGVSIGKSRAVKKEAEMAAVNEQDEYSDGGEEAL